MGNSDDRAAAWAAFLEVWTDLRERSAVPMTVVVVEGERDRAALRALQVEGEIALVHRGRPLAQVAQEIGRGAREVILLTDWDTAGGQLAQRLREFLQADGVALDWETRRRLARALRGEVVHVEGLAGWARRSADREGVTLEAALAEATLGRRRRPTG